MMKKLRALKQWVYLILTVVACFSVMNMAASAATWRTGPVPSFGNSAYTTVHLDNVNEGAVIKLHAYSFLITPSNASETSASFHVTVRAANGSWVWEGDVTTGTQGEIIQLGNDYAAYMICIRLNAPAFGAGASHNVNYWGIQCVSNCSV